ncbi:Myblike DNAbinding domain-containing protein [Mortierella hygrophila]|uniref:Myblike DNAbinding domain-containing protein n=1 Tax=Mortierella hygrophila TaxID=979708 RepID=A0A9P6FIJ7_9FUNG|nr:Myblike DNAbinding domain-containing protein [Mortierella hygrophila]
MATAGRLRSVVVLSTRSPATATASRLHSTIPLGLGTRSTTVSPSLSRRIPQPRATFTTLSNHSALTQDQPHVPSSSAIDVENSQEQDWRSKVIVTSSPTPYTVPSINPSTTTSSSSTSSGVFATANQSDNDSDNDGDDQAYTKRKMKFTPEMDKEILRLRDEVGFSWSVIGSKLGVPHRACHRRYTSLLDPKLKDAWPEEKVQRLDALVAEGKTWSEIAKELDDSSMSCQAKWKALVKPMEAERNRVFDTLQSRVLLELVREHGPDDWKAVFKGFMLELGGRDMAKVTPEQLRHQYYRLKRKPTRYWSLNEETALIQHVLKHGTGQWGMISEALKYHSPDQCKEKWTTMDMSNKTPKVKAWYKTEQANFWRLWQRFDQEWEKIARSLPARTPEQCRDYFNRATEKLDRTDELQFKKEVENLAAEMSQYRTITWTKEDSDRLWEVAEGCKSGLQSRRVNWNIVAERMNLDLTPAQYKHHHYYLRTVRNGGLAGLWTDAEIKKLEMAVQAVGRNWTLIAKEYFPHRNSKSLCHKFHSVVNKGQYITDEEYYTLMAKVDLQEKEFNSSATATGATFTPDWQAIAKDMPGVTWTAEQCRKAYDGSFRNHLKNSKWTAEEDSRLMKATKALGRKNWVGLAAAVSGKDSWECRMRLAQLHEPLVEGAEALPGLASKTKEQIFHVTVD